jgi:uncharacterized membrane protein
MRLARNAVWIIAALLIAVVVHAASLLLVPRVAMARAITLMTRIGPLNTMTQAPRATAASRAIVRPSPDLLYSSCPYDLGAIPGGMLHVHARGLPKTYWSVSAFDADTNNFFVRNDRQAGNGAVDFVIVARGVATNGIELPVIVSPTMRGIVLFRTLIDDDKRLAEIDAARKRAACEAYEGR